MLRALVIVLVVANVVYFAWTHGALAGIGAQPARFHESEPQRLQQQVRPELLQIRKDPSSAQ
jgi:hypothetical protein